MDLDKVWSIMEGCMLGAIICSLIALATESMFFSVLAIGLMIGWYVMVCFFWKCPYCNHALPFRGKRVSYCPYCGGYL